MNNEMWRLCCSKNGEMCFFAAWTTERRCLKWNMSGSAFAKWMIQYTLMSTHNDGASIFFPFLPDIVWWVARMILHRRVSFAQKFKCHLHRERPKFNRTNSPWNVFLSHRFSTVFAGVQVAAKWRFSSDSSHSDNFYVTRNERKKNSRRKFTSLSVVVSSLATDIHLIGIPLVFIHRIRVE